MFVDVKTIKLSICECGFPILSEHISLNTEYQINPNEQRELILICGGCKSQIKCNCVMANGPKPGYLPMDIFSTPTMDKVLMTFRIGSPTGNDIAKANRRN